MQAVSFPFVHAGRAKAGKAAGGKHSGRKAALPIFPFRLVIGGMSYAAGIYIAHIHALIADMRHIHASVGQHCYIQPAAVIYLTGQRPSGSARLIPEGLYIEYLGHIARISVSVNVHFSFLPLP